MPKDLSCLSNIVGYRTPCETIASRSGYMLNNLHGVSFRFAESISSEEYKSGKEFIDDKLKQAKLMVIDEMETHLRPYFRFNAAFPTFEMCTYTDGFDAPYANNRGIKIQKLSKSPYVKLYISKIRVWLQQQSTITVYIDDGGILTTTSAITLQTNTPTDIQLNYHAVTDTVRIYFNQTAINVKSTSCTVGCLTCGGGHTNYNNINSEIVVYGFDQASEGAITFNGIVPTIGMQCDITNLICELNEWMALPILYKWGGLFYGEVANTSRINKYTEYTKDKAKEMSVYYDNIPDSEDTKEGLYQKQMRSVINSIFPYLKNMKDECVECNQSRYGWVLP